VGQREAERVREGILERRPLAALNLLLEGCRAGVNEKGRSENMEGFENKDDQKIIPGRTAV